MALHPTLETSEVLTCQEAARRLGVHPATIRRWVDAGRLPALRIGPSGRIRIRVSDLASVVKVA